MPVLIWCFKCGGIIQKDEPRVFSEEWDAFCHVYCCPAFNKYAKVTKECKVCDVYRLRVLNKGVPGGHSCKT